MKLSKPVLIKLKEKTPLPEFSKCPTSNAQTNKDASIIKEALDIIGGMWKVLIVFQLGINGLCRFGELKKLLPGVTQRMLTLALREMETDGLVTRKIYAQIPPKVEYSLTQKGADLKKIYLEVLFWGQNHLKTAKIAEID
jgi:DNA-binding HxlR family transcriptional regulator